MGKLERKHVLQILIVVLAIMLGLVTLILTGINNVDFVDTKDYVYTAGTLLQKGYYTDSYFFPLFRPPLYPFFLAGVWLIFPDSMPAVKIVQVLFHAVTCWLVFKIAYEITRDEILSFIGALIFVLNPLFLYMAVGIQSESLHTFLMTWALFLLVRMLMAGEIKLSWAIQAGIVLGLAALNKPSALGVGVVLAGMLFLLLYRSKKSFIGTVALVAAMFLTLLPWSLYILKTRGELILISDAGGYNLWVGNHPGLIPLYRGDFTNAADADKQEQSILDERERVIAEWTVTKNYQNLSLKEREALWRNAAIERMVTQPAMSAELFAWKFYILWRPFANSLSHSVGKSLLAGAVLVPLYFFGLWGLLKLWKDRVTRRVVWMFIALVASVTAIHVIILTSMRYRLPYVDPFLMICTGISLGGLLLKAAAKVKFLSFVVPDNRPLGGNS